MRTEKEIEKKRVEVKKDNDFAEFFDKALDVKDGSKVEVEMETEIKGSGDGNGKKILKEGCCGCGRCDEFRGLSSERSRETGFYDVYHSRTMLGMGRCAIAV